MISYNLNSHSRNCQILIEFDGFPLYINVFVNTCKYLHRLLTSSCNLCAFKESFDISPSISKRIKDKLGVLCKVCIKIDRGLF